MLKYWPLNKVHLGHLQLRPILVFLILATVLNRLGLLRSRIPLLLIPSSISILYLLNQLTNMKMCINSTFLSLNQALCIHPSCSWPVSINASSHANCFLFYLDFRTRLYFFRFTSIRILQGQTLI